MINRSTQIVALSIFIFLNMPTKCMEKNIEELAEEWLRVTVLQQQAEKKFEEACEQSKIKLLYDRLIKMLENGQKEEVHKLLIELKDRDVENVDLCNIVECLINIASVSYENSIGSKGERKKTVVITRSNSLKEKFKQLERGFARDFSVACKVSCSEVKKDDNEGLAPKKMPIKHMTVS